MIAAGLCMMGGCFAMDSTGNAVDTYWPAHAVRISDRRIFIKNYTDAEPLLSPYWYEGMKSGSRIENVSWDMSVNATSPGLVNMGTWVSPVCDSIYFGSSSPWHKNGIYAAVIAKYMMSEKDAVIISTSADSPVEFMEYNAEYPGFSVTAPDFFESKTITNFSGVSFNAAGRIAFLGDLNTYDVVSCWFTNDSLQRYFMVQPMQSIDGFEAFFTHYFNILTEL